MDDEIDLRQYLSVFWRRRYSISAVTLAAILASALLSFYVLKPVYEASAILIISNPRFQITSPRLQTALTPVPTVENLIPMVHNEVVAVQVAKRLPISQTATGMRDLVEKAKLTGVRSTNLLKVIARGSSPREAVTLAGAWAETIVEYIDSLGLQETRQTLSILEAKINTARGELEDADRSLTDFRAGSKIPVLDQRIQETVRRIALYESRLTEIEQGGAPIGGEVALQPSGGSYTLTVTSVRDPAQIRKVLAVLKLNLTGYQGALAVERQRETQLFREVELASSTHQLLVQKREELRVLLGPYTGMVKIAVPPIAPEVPIAPRRVLNITLAAILGMMAGTITAFVMEYFSPVVPTPSPSSAAPVTPNPAPRREVEG